MNLQNRRLVIIVLTSGFILLIPLLAMQFTSQVLWTPADFVIAGLLLLGTGLAIEFTIRKAKNINYRIVAIVTILIGFILIWAELAVGILGTPFSVN